MVGTSRQRSDALADPALAIRWVADELGQQRIADALGLDRKTVNRRLTGANGEWSWADLVVIARLEQESLFTDRLRRELIASLLVEDESGEPVAVIGDAAEAMAAAKAKAEIIDQLSSGSIAPQLYERWRQTLEAELRVNRKLDRDLAVACGRRSFLRAALAGAAVCIVMAGCVKAALGRMGDIMRARRVRRRDEIGLLADVVPA